MWASQIDVLNNENGAVIPYIFVWKSAWWSKSRLWLYLPACFVFVDALSAYVRVFESKFLISTSITFRLLPFVISSKVMSVDENLSHYIFFQFKSWIKKHLRSADVFWQDLPNLSSLITILQNQNIFMQGSIHLWLVPKYKTHFSTEVHFLTL